MCDYCDKCTITDTEDDIEELQNKLKKMRVFLWENVIEPNCTYRSKHPDGSCWNCSAGLAPKCDLNLCPRLKPELW